MVCPRSYSCSEEEPELEFRQLWQKVGELGFKPNMLDAKAQPARLHRTVSLDAWKVETAVLVDKHVTWDLYSHSSGCNKISSSHTGLLASDSGRF